MKRDCIFHARYKLRYNGKLANNISYIEEGLTCIPLNEDEKMKYTIGSNGGITIAILKNTDGTLNWGFAKCNKTDTYCKRIGRNIAIGRAKKYIIKTNDYEFQDVRKKVMKLIDKISHTGLAETIASFKENPESSIWN
jgi:hypothetical protein